MALKFAVNNSLSAITTLPSSISGGALNLISTQTASASASLEFSLDDSYDSYIFKFINIHPQTDDVRFEFNMSTDSGSNYNVTKTTTTFRAYHNESDSASALIYDTGRDQAQSTDYQRIFLEQCGADNDQNGCGTLQIFNPSSSVFVKHFLCTTNHSQHNDYTVNGFLAGYGNTTSPINSIIFRMSSGNIDDGIIKMYGVS